MISMKITEDVRKYAAEQGDYGDAEALERGMEGKSRDFAEQGADIYAEV